MFDITTFPYGNPSNPEVGKQFLVDYIREGTPILPAKRAAVLVDKGRDFYIFKFPNHLDDRGRAIPCCWEKEFTKLSDVREQYIDELYEDLTAHAKKICEVNNFNKATRDNIRNQAEHLFELGYRKVKS